MGEGSSYLLISDCDLKGRWYQLVIKKEKMLLLDNLTVFVRFLTDYALFIGFSYRPYRVKICITCDSWSQYRH